MLYVSGGRERNDVLRSETSVHIVVGEAEEDASALSARSRSLSLSALRQAVSVHLDPSTLKSVA